MLDSKMALNILVANIKHKMNGREKFSISSKHKF